MGPRNIMSGKIYKFNVYIESWGCEKVKVGKVIGGSGEVQSYDAQIWHGYGKDML